MDPATSLVPGEGQQVDLPSRPLSASEDQEDSRSSSSNDSPAPVDNEESDFYLINNDSQSSLGVPNFQDMAVDDTCWPPVNRLPNEILIAIFAKLSASADLYHSMLVSKRWARNAVDLLWHRPACNNWKNHSTICQTLGVERPFFSYKDFIRRLNLAALAENVNDGSVQPLAVCTRVERLTLTNCKGLTDSGLISLVTNSSSLLALDISNDRNITEESINAIAEHCKRLQGLNISGCSNISNESMINLAQSCKYIKRLKLNDCSQLRDNAIHAFAENCPNILEIDLHQCVHIGNSPVTALLAKGNCLRELRLVNCELIDDSAFLNLPSNKVFEHLRILDLTSCLRLTDAAVTKIIDAAPRLRNLVLAKCRHITDAAVFAISKLGKNLHYVHLGHCNQITDNGVKRLVHNCNRIRYIDLGCCINLTDESVKRLALLPKLKRIGLVKCSSITDESVFTLAEAAYRPRVRRDASGVFIGGEYYASSLERVHLSYCTNLTLKSIVRLLNSCPRLTHLSLTGVAAFQRDDFQPFCRSAPAEFTQHQRDVFCVFSGNMVSQFRNFLNTSAEFEELRASQLGPNRRPRGHIMNINGAPARPSDEIGAVDDEMADEEPDYENVYGQEMVVDAQTAIASHIQQHHSAAGHDGSAPDPSPLAHLPAFAQAMLGSGYGPPPIPPQNHSHPLSQHSAQNYLASRPPPLAYSSFLTSQPAHGQPPLSALGVIQATQASQASVGASGQADSAGAVMTNGASTASMHSPQPQEDGENHQYGAAD